MNSEYQRKLIEQHNEIQAAVADSVKHLVSDSDEILAIGNARVENYPGRRRPVHPHEDFMGYLIATKKLLIYKDNYGEIVLHFSDIKKIKVEEFPLPSTMGLMVELDNLYTYFSAVGYFARDLAAAFKQGMWREERSRNPKSKNLLTRILRE